MCISTLHRSPRRRSARLALSGWRFHRPGRCGLAACVLLAGCAPKAEPGSAPGPVFLPGVRYEFYDVEGATARELAASIRQARPSSQAGIGQTTWNVSWQAEWEGNPCRVRWAEVRSTIVVSMPRWNAPPGAPPRLVKDWNEMVRALSVHEAGHVEHALEAERELRRTLMRVTASSCSLMTLRTNQVAQWVLDEARTGDRRYDERTRGGWTQGVVWPPGALPNSTTDSAREEEPAQPQERL